ncbi:unnamed protein product [Mesocestoides corti]|uniref:Secreted protein n=1 Tax=Mesocestoides corti TaxID=53468 RepID=A0A0R3UHT4_MESCO|nr:unnamed protein product [Mesocestoides corti]
MMMMMMVVVVVVFDSHHFPLTTTKRFAIIFPLVSSLESLFSQHDRISQLSSALTFYSALDSSTLNDLTIRRHAQRFRFALLETTIVDGIVF